ALPEGATEMRYALGTDATTAPNDGWNASIPTGTEAKTYYVWYKAVGTDGHADSAVACVTVTISEPSSGGGGGGYTIEPTTETAPSTPTETYTIPVENESSVNVQADIQNGNAKVAEITEEDIHKVTEGSSGEDSQGKTVDNNTILIDLSGATQKVKSVELSKTTMERLAETATSTENKIETVTVQLTNVTVELDAKTLSAVTQQAEGNSINLVVEDTNASTLNSDQQQALSEFTSASTFEAYFESAGSRIHDFKGGEATVSMKFTPAQGLSITHYHVYYVATSGKLERFVTRFIKTLIKAEKSDKRGAAEGEGILQFTTTHFSDYAIVYDETMENATGQEEADDTSSGEDKTKTANGKSSYENGLSINKGLKVSQKGEMIQISWGTVKGADGYDVYVQYCGKTFSSKPAMSVNREVTSVTIKKINGKKLNLKKNYKIFVVAYKNVEGKKKRLAKSIVAHIVGVKNTRYSNPKELTITSDTDVTLEKGKTSKIKARVILANAKRKSLSDAHAPMFRYASSDKKIATVDKKGKITAKKQGSCLIWVYAKNGYAKKVKVTVK
ncbi:MAG: Ig-like domain-containing protein, partial [Lachnospiraceae bacterium]|nr:Ig-like domain-containing protein [Lachnospiraceae bacterium]